MGHQAWSCVLHDRFREMERLPHLRDVITKRPYRRVLGADLDQDTHDMEMHRRLLQVCQDTAIPDMADRWQGCLERDPLQDFYYQEAEQEETDIDTHDPFTPGCEWHDDT